MEDTRASLRPTPSRSGPPKARLWDRFRASWISKTMLVGVGATGVDVALGTTLATIGVPTQAAAMAGTMTGSVLSFFGNRYLAFRDSNSEMTWAAFRYALVTLALSAIHGRLVAYLRDDFGVPFLPAKLLCDVLIFTSTQPLVLRYVVFPRDKPAPAPQQ